MAGPFRIKLPAALYHIASRDDWLETAMSLIVTASRSYELRQRQLPEYAKHFKLHYSTVSSIVNHHKSES